MEEHLKFPTHTIAGGGGRGDEGDGNGTGSGGGGGVRAGGERGRHLALCHLPPPLITHIVPPTPPQPQTPLFPLSLVLPLILLCAVLLPTASGPYPPFLPSPPQSLSPHNLSLTPLPLFQTSSLSPCYSTGHGAWLQLGPIAVVQSQHCCYRAEQEYVLHATGCSEDGACWCWAKVKRNREKWCVGRRLGAAGELW